MIPLNRHQLATVAVCCVASIGTGCKTPSVETEAPALWHASGFHPTVPAQPFDNCEVAFEYIAKYEQIARDRHTMFGLATDSKRERVHFDETGDLVVVEAQYYGDSRFGIRGAQGQGRYYAFQTLERKWKLVGIFHGNTFRWDTGGDKLRVITKWHLSAAESPETVYTWNESLFE